MILNTIQINAKIRSVIFPFIQQISDYIPYEYNNVPDLITFHIPENSYHVTAENLMYFGHRQTYNYYKCAAISKVSLLEVQNTHLYKFIL